jgi:hypothetical protein
MNRERLWYPPRSFETVAHYALETLRVDGRWATYTEHASRAGAEAHLARMADRWPGAQLRITERNA